MPQASDDRRSGSGAEPANAAAEQQQRRHGKLIKRPFSADAWPSAVPGSPAWSRPRARRRGRRGRRRATAWARPPAARALGERPGDAREGDHQAYALQGRSRSDLAISGMPRATTNGEM